MTRRVDYDETALDQAAGFLTDYPAGLRSVLDAVDQLVADPAPGRIVSARFTPMCADCGWVATGCCSRSPTMRSRSSASPASRPLADVGRRSDHQKLKAAEQACRKYNPINEANSISSGDLAKLRKMSYCVRDQGIAKYPDPDTNGAVNLDKSSGISPDDPSLKKALDECKKYGPAAVQGN